MRDKPSLPTRMRLWSACIPAVLYHCGDDKSDELFHFRVSHRVEQLWKKHLDQHPHLLLVFGWTPLHAPKQDDQSRQKE
ncbi:hypothetical protein E2C01_064489 [Portunus trituberculatus]|uniref:Uncharacterized protein n=1 Tax=Portunus trituberculatus TaxID=210409 RepID=A0A5B7HLX9_PORTR|nr:hypothetical protein [Portunus trituberculatus]